MARARRFLLVSDDPSLLEPLRALCRSASAEPSETGDGLEARRLTASLWPDVIFTAGPRPGAEWLRTLPQGWHEIPPGAGGWQLPQGVRAFSVSGDPPSPQG
jgi:DNA-binding response OmpR family regulator